MLADITNIEKAYSRKIHKFDAGFFELFLLFFGLLFSYFFIYLIPVVVYLWAWLEFKSDSDIGNGKELFSKAMGYALIYTAWLLIALVITVVSKKVFNRDRPDVININRLMNLRSKESNNSFPSGDTLQSAYFSGFMLFVFGNPYMMIWAPMTAFARVYYQCHWIWDTVFGWLIGFIISYGSYATTQMVYG